MYLIFQVHPLILKAQKGGAAMAEQELQRSLARNLEDAGCDPQTIRQFGRLLGAGRVEEGLALLETHRRRLLDSVHQQEKRIDCLDYLIYQITQKQEALPHGRKTGFHTGMG